MEKGYLRRPLATLLSLLMVIGMFTVCGFGALAEGETVDVTLKTWSVDELDAAALATGTLNSKNSLIYHKTDYTIGAERDDQTQGGGWMFHSQGLINSDNNKDGTPDYFVKGDTLRVVAYLKGELRGAGAWGRIEVAYNNDSVLTHKKEFTPEVIAQLTDTGMGDGIKKLTWEFKLDEDGYSEIGQLLQTRIWVNGGAYMACYGVEYINLTSNKVLWGMEPAKGKAGSDIATLITQPGLSTYCLHPIIVSGVPEANRQYTAQDYEGDFDTTKNGDVNSVLFNNLGGEKLAAGKYRMSVDFATKYALGTGKFTFNVYAGEEKIFGYKVTQTDIVDARQWSPDSGIQRVFDFDFEVSEANAGKPITYEIVCHNQTHFTLFGMTLKQRVSVGDTLAQWDYKDLLAETDRSQMGVTSYNEEEGKTIVGIQAWQNIGTNGLWMTNEFTGIDASANMAAGQTIRFTLKMLSDHGKGYSGGGPFIRVYGNGGSVGIADGSVGWDVYKNAPMQYDPVYGYAYKAIDFDVTLTEAQAASAGNLHHLFAIPGCQYSNDPVTIYSLTAVNLTTGKEVYTVDAAKLSSVKNTAAGEAVRDVYASPAGSQIPVGYRAVMGSGQVWSRFNANVSVASAPVQTDDELEVGVAIWVDNGYDDTEYRFGLEMFSVSDGKQFGNGLNLDNDHYNSIPVSYDPDYGYAYKQVVHTYTITDEFRDRINASDNAGVYSLIGTHSPDTNGYDKHPLSIYRYYVYNKTQNVYYIDVTGEELLNLGGSGTTNETVYVMNGNAAYANDGYVHAGQDITFDSLTASAPFVGQYAMNFAVTGEKDAEYTLTAYAVDGDSVKPVGAKTFTATGSAQTVAVAFNARESLVGKELTFGITTKNGKLDVETVAFQYVGALAAEYSWDVADIAAASLDKNMTYEFTNQVVIGAKVKNTPWEIFAQGSHWTGPIAGISKNDVLRMEVDLSTDQTVTNLAGQMAKLGVANDHDNLNYTSETTTYTGTQYNALEEKFNKDYGYSYRTLTAKVTVPDNDALVTAITTGGGLNFLLYECQIADVGRNVYRAAIINETTGETVYEVSGAAIRPLLFATAQDEDIVVTDGSYDKVIGLEVNGDNNFPASNGLWATADIAVEGVTFVEGHTIRFVQKMNVVDDKLTGGGPFYRVYHNAVSIADTSLGWDIYNSAEVQVDPDYGYTYREIPYEVTITAGQACSDAHITHWVTTPGADYNTSVHQFYEFAAYDVTDDNKLLYTISGATLAKANKSENIVSEPIEVSVVDSDKASAVIFSEGAEDAVTKPLSVTFADLGLGAGVYQFAVKGDESVCASAMIQLGEYGDIYTIGEGEFVVTEDILNAPIGFVLDKQAGAAATVSGVDLMMVRELTEDDTQNYQEELDKINQAAADPVIDKIAALPETISESDEGAIQEARAAYDALTESQKVLVDNLAKLEKAEADLAEIKNTPAEAREVIAKINALPEAEALTLENETAVNEAKAAYDALSDANKDYVGEDLVTKLNANVAKMAELKDQAAADAVIAKINAIDADNPTKETVTAAREAYDALTDTQKNLVGAEVYKKLTDAEAKLAIKFGDINGDDKIDASDALQALQHSVELIKLEGDKFTAADVNDDGKVDASDALMILQCSVELIKAEDFPAAKK